MAPVSKKLRVREHVKLKDFLNAERELLVQKCAELQDQKQGLTAPEWNMLAANSLSVKEFDAQAEIFLRLTTKASDEYLITLFESEVLARPTSVESVNLDTCPACNQDFIQGNESCLLYCDDCGLAITFMDSSSNAMAFGDEVEYTSFSYKRINHLKEWITHFQAKETTVINADVYRAIMQVLRAKGFQKADDVLMRDVKRALKELGYKKYYDMTMNIWTTITGRSPIRFDPVFIEKLHLMFRRIQIPFATHCPPKRKNFLSYPYLMFKFSQLLGYNQFLPYFTLLKGPDKLQVQEQTFKKICDDISWLFIPIPAKFIPKEDKRR
jgi:hypothetical protein